MFKVCRSKWAKSPKEMLVILLENNVLIQVDIKL